jgi:hypothetical protein
MKHLAIFYTDNKICSKALKEVLLCFMRAVSHPSFIDTVGVIISANPVLELLEFEHNNVKKIIAPGNIINKGHLSINEKFYIH